MRGRDCSPVTLYSDLLLHDMGAALDDKILQGTATGAEWRTAPLVSLRLRQRTCTTAAAPACAMPCSPMAARARSCETASEISASPIRTPPTHS